MSTPKRKWQTHLDNTKPADGFESLVLLHLDHDGLDRVYKFLNETDADFRVSLSLLRQLEYIDRFDGRIPSEVHFSPSNYHVRFRDDAIAVIFKLSIA